MEEIRNIKTEVKNLKDFGITIGIVLLLIAAFLYFKDLYSYNLLFFIAGIFIGLGLTLPIILKPFYLIWMTFAVLIGWFMTRLILSLLFFTIITPIGVIFRLTGKDFLKIKKIKQNSYWNYRNSEIEKNQNYEKQF